MSTITIDTDKFEELCRCARGALYYIGGKSHTELTAALDAFQVAPVLSEWRDDEIGYVVLLIAHNGDRNVPMEAIGSYIDVQLVRARIDGRHDVVVELERQRQLWLERRRI